MGDKHISSQFDNELNGISAKVMEMGGLVESQLRQAIYAFLEMDLLAADTVLDDGVHSRLADWVVEEVRAWPADVVVLGTHGRRGVGRMLLGSDAEQVLRICPVPVLLVRGQDTE